MFQNNFEESSAIHKIVFQEPARKRDYKATLALIGYLFYGVGIALFVLGVAFSIFAMLNHPNFPDSEIDGTATFLKSLVPWIVSSVIFLIAAPIVFRLGTDQEQKIVPRNKGESSLATIKGTIVTNALISGTET